MFGVRPGKRRKRRITSSKTETESTNDRSFTSCWSIHPSPVPKAKQPCDAACACSLPSSKGLASCACICSCRPAGASSSRPVHALCLAIAIARASMNAGLPRSRSSFNERVHACGNAPMAMPDANTAHTYGFVEMRAFARALHAAAAPGSIALVSRTAACASPGSLVVTAWRKSSLDWNWKQPGIFCFVRAVPCRAVRPCPHGMALIPDAGRDR